MKESGVSQLNLDRKSAPAALVNAALPGAGQAVRVRPGTTDGKMFEQVFVAKEYDVELPFVPRWIVDAGANVGYSAIAFACRYPGARVIAIEPDADNFALLRENTLPYPNIEPVRAGVWSRSGHLQLITHDSAGQFLGEWGYRVAEIDQAEHPDAIPTVTLGQLLRASGARTLDLLKLDVEGAEQEIFANDCSDWLPRTNVLMVDLHDRFRPGCSDAFFSRVEHRQFHSVQRGKTLILIRKQLVL
jgi:FkbM family methyltransferase